MKTCRKCSIELVVGDTWTAGREKTGQFLCRDCCNARNVAWRKANPEKTRANNAAWKKANPERLKAIKTAWRKANPEKSRASNAAWRKANPGVEKASNAAWKKANSEKVNALTAKRRAAKLQRTPSWLTKADWAEIDGFFMFASKMPGNWQVDHIIPLQGEFVSGLNVPSNLQILSASENSSKGNRIDLEMAA